MTRSKKKSTEILSISAALAGAAPEVAAAPALTLAPPPAPAQVALPEMQPWYDGLNAEQRAGVDHDDGPCVMEATAGSGKTRVVVFRIARMIRARRIPGERIVAVTFSTKGASEMNTRLARMDIATCRVGTWHSLTLQILKEDRTVWGGWKIDDRDRGKTLLKEALGYKHVNWKKADLGKVKKFITHCKANLLTWEDPEAMEAALAQFGQHDMHNALEAFEVSQRLIEAEGLLTFDDFFTFAVRHLRSSEAVRARWADRWSHMVVDEYQDNNRAQDTMMELLCRDHRNLFVVGDRFQAIYAFRGSSPEYIRSFQERWSSRRIAVVRNYRSGRTIVGAANAIAKPSAHRLPEDMIAERDLDGQVRALRCTNLDDEARMVADWARQHRDTGNKLTDLAVLFRLNAQSRALEEALLKAKLPYLIVGGSSFYERKEVKDLLGYLRLASGREGPGDADGDALRRSINAPFRFLGRAFVDRVMQTADQHAGTAPTTGFWSAVVRESAQQQGVQRRQKESAVEWAEIVEKAAVMATPHPVEDSETGAVEVKEEAPSVILNWIVDRTGYIAAIEQEEGEESVETSGAANVREMIRVATSFKTVRELLDYVDATIKAAQKQRRDGQAGGDRLLLMSVHKSKGLEWPRVWVVGLNEKVLPHAKGDPEEERRLAYVAATRARDDLTLSFVTDLVTKAGMRAAEPSRYLKDAGLLAAAFNETDCEVADAASDAAAAAPAVPS